MQQKLNKSAWDTGLDNSLNLIVGTVGQIRNGPAGIDQDLVIERVNKLRKDRKGRSNLFEKEGVRYHQIIMIKKSRKVSKIHTVFQSG